MHMHIHVPNQLSENSNQKFRNLYKKHFELEISVDEADNEAYRLLSFFAIIIENTPKYHSE